MVIKSPCISVNKLRNNLLLITKVLQMNPRTKTISKWTELPPELKKQISTIFEQNFKEQIGEKGEIHTNGRIYPAEILLSVGIHKKGELRFHNFEVSIDHKNDKEKIVELIYLAVDAIASLMVEYFENDEDIELPYTWLQYPFGTEKVWLQFSTVNPTLEAEADRLLGLATDEATILKNAEAERSLDALDATEDEFDELVKHIDMEQMQVPTMFKSKKKKDDLH